MEEKNKKCIKISIVINILIVICTIFSCIVMFTGIKFMEGEDLLESTAIGMFRFFTVDSNIFMGIIALLFANKQIQLLKGKVNEVSTKMYVLKLIATVGVTLTFVTVFGYLGHIAQGGIYSMIRNSNLFFHLITPVLSVLTFVMFEKNDKLKFKYTILGISTSLLYGLFYLINVLLHIENGQVPVEYDWYWFVQGGLWQIAVVIPLMFGVTYVIALLLWRCNRIK